MPRATIKIGDSIKAVKIGGLSRQKYNFIVIDNSPGTFGEKRNYCEHFDLFPEIFNYITNERTIFVMNVVINVDTIVQWGNLTPSCLSEWLKRRKRVF